MLAQALPAALGMGATGIELRPHLFDTSPHPLLDAFIFGSRAHGGDPRLEFCDPCFEPHDLERLPLRDLAPTSDVMQTVGVAR